MDNEEFKKLAKNHNGVESLSSTLRRKYNIDKMPARGNLSIKLYFGFKIAALNFKKLYKYYDGLLKCVPKLITG